MIGNYLWCKLSVWCSCRTCINYSIRPGYATCGPNAMQQSGFLCRSLVLDRRWETKAWLVVESV